MEMTTHLSKKPQMIDDVWKTAVINDKLNRPQCGHNLTLGNTASWLRHAKGEGLNPLLVREKSQ